MGTHETQRDYWRLMRPMETQRDYWRLMRPMGTHETHETNGDS